MRREHLPPQRRKKERLITPAIFLIFKLVAAYRGRLLLYVYVIAVNDADSAVVLCVVELAGWRHRHCCTWLWCWHCYISEVYYYYYCYLVLLIVIIIIIITNICRAQLCNATRAVLTVDLQYVECECLYMFLEHLVTCPMSALQQVNYLYNWLGIDSETLVTMRSLCTWTSEWIRNGRSQVRLNETGWHQIAVCCQDDGVRSHWHSSTAVLKMILCSAGRHCSLQSIGIMCSYLDPAIIDWWRAAHPCPRLHHQPRRLL